MSVLALDIEVFAGRLRALGALVIHSPSGVVSAYDDVSQRWRAKLSPLVVPLAPILAQGHDPAREGPWPLDDRSDVCPCSPPCLAVFAGKRQHSAITIHSKDIISDDGTEVHNILQNEHCQVVLITGVALNLCVMERSFGVRQMVRLGYDVTVCSDLVDVAYNPRRYPYVSCEQAILLTLKHIARYWCGVKSSSEILAVLAANGQNSASTSNPT